MTTTELETYTVAEGGLDRLDRHAVTELLERGKTWLRLALDRDTEIGELVNYKAEANVLRELVVQKELGKDAELAATELIRRAERSIGVAIRKAQERGEVGSPAHPSPYKRRRAEADLTGVTSEVAAPTDFASSDELARGIYPMTDDVTDEAFDEAVDEAKAERNLSRANVVRKVKKQPLRSESKRPEVLRKTRRFDSRTVVSKTVAAAADVITPSLLAEVNYDELGTEDLREWISSLNDSIKALTSLRTHLTKELTHR